jgi:glucose/arabinose dehydrogenase
MRKLYLKKPPIFLFPLFFYTIQLIAQPVLSLAPVISGLNAPMQLVNAGDGTNRIFIVHRDGAITVYDESYHSLGTFLTVSEISIDGEGGLLSMAFPPDYENTDPTIGGFFYVYYTNSDGDLEIARYHVSGGNPDEANPEKTVVLNIPHPSSPYHNGGTIHFGSDGYLYLATGDGGDGAIPSNAQDGTSLLGKMLRIDVNTSLVSPFYSVPTDDNPYINDPTILDEIWAFGLRNPFRWSFDRLTNDIWIADVGEGSWEEINFRTANSTGGINYGWRCYEGNAEGNLTGCGPAAGYIFPVFVYENPASGPAAVTGGTVYRGTTVPTNASLYGYYLAADFYSGDIYKIIPNGAGGWSTFIQDAVQTGIVNFGETENGEVYAVSLTDGTVFSITTVSAAPLPVTLIEFNASPGNGVVHLDWKTSSEENLQQFEIEYSIDGNSFIGAGIIPASNAAGGSEYTFSHEPSSSGRVFYRLKMTDFDGQFKYSDILTINVNRTNKSFVQPSVITSNMINVFLNNSFNTLELINMNGAMLLKQNIKGRIGKIDIPVPFVTTGTYIVQLRNNETTLRQLILIRQ